MTTRTALSSAPYVWTAPPLGEAMSAPPGFYTDSAVFRAEVEHIHLKSWFFVGRTEELPDQGDYKALETIGGPVLLVRDGGMLKAFANVCRHRSSILLEGRGCTNNSIICPYHGWTYGLDGTLLAAPGMRKVPKFEKLPYGLRGIRLEVWDGAIFLNYDTGAPSLAAHLGNLPDLLGSHGFGEMAKTWEIQIEAACNWKLLVENAMETFHTGVVHAATVGAQRSVSFRTTGEWLGIQVLASQSIAVLDREPPFPPIANLSDRARKGTFFALIHPTTQFACAQDCIWWLAVRPLAVDRSVLSVGGCFPRTYTSYADFGARAAPYYTRWEAVAREDIAILERQQRGLSSRFAEPGPLSWRDDMVLAINRWVMARLPKNFVEGLYRPS